jgi:predicted nuclease of predicted toxin-antitoxin system
MDIAAPVVCLLREQGMEVLSTRDEGWGAHGHPDISSVHAMARLVLTHDSDFGMLTVHRGEAITGISYLRSGGCPPTEVMVDLRVRMDTEIDCTPPVIAVYRSGHLRLRKLWEEVYSGYGNPVGRPVVIHVLG